MTAENEYVDPRSELTHDIVAGQVYADDRSGDQYRILYTDASVVVLRENADSGDGHLLSSREQFEENVGADRFTLVEPTSQSPREPDDYESVRALIKRKHDEYSASGTRTAQHKAEAMAEFLVEFEEQIAVNDDPIDFESIDGIGPKAAQNLREAGIETELDVTRADRDAIESIPLMGAKNTDNLLAVVED